MCETCGCSDHGHFTINSLSTSKGQSHEHSPSDDSEYHVHIQIEENILSKNNLLAERNRGYFQARRIKAINSPGSGKTTLLEVLIREMKQVRPIYVIEGDQQTSEDAKRIQNAGADAIQINTGNGCHLDAHMINHALNELDPEINSILFIENVGNLVCPALFDLGEELRIVVASVTEGEDKPLKYAAIFRSAQVCILNKMDILPHLDFSVDKFRANLDMVNPGMPFFAVSAKTGSGLAEILEIISKQN
jgi:hydrogenase nickel incorporation protein HypB